MAAPMATATAALATEPMNRDDLIAHHVEALVGLGWRWEGNALIPRWDAQPVTAFDDQRLSLETINHPNGGCND